VAAQVVRASEFCLSAVEMIGDGQLHLGLVFDLLGCSFAMSVCIFIKSDSHFS